MTNEIVSVNEIKAILPHRYPFLLVDRIIDIKKNKSCIGIKNFTINEEFFLGHFPDTPIVPGVLLLEALAQAGAILVVKSSNAEFGTLGVLLSTVENAKFRKSVVPGDTLKMMVEILGAKMGFYTIRGRGFVDDDLVIEGTFTALVYDKRKRGTK
jgi:beta-hydroxyacyl-ACP dehydratase FabZ